MQSLGALPLAVRRLATTRGFLASRVGSGLAIARALLVIGLCSWPVVAASDPREMDAGNAPPFDIGGPGPSDSWTVATVSGLTLGSRLGSLWVDPGGDLYVWSSRREMPGASEGDSPRLDPATPNDPGGIDITPITSSTLHRWDGTRWTKSLELVGEEAVSVFGAGDHHLYAATNLASGGIRLYHFDGKHWRLEKLPRGTHGRAGSFAGTQSDLYFRAGDAILRRHGSTWKRVFVDPGLDHDCGRTLVYLGHHEVIAPCCQGQAVWNGRGWRWHSAPGERDVHAAWGMRDAQGALLLFAAGSDPGHSGPSIWSFAESGSRLEGEFNLCRSEPHFGGCETVGYHAALWGTGPSEVFAAGTFDGWGRVCRFDGEAWRHEQAFDRLPPCTGLGGNERDLWVALADGRLLHRASPALQAKHEKHGRKSVHRALALPGTTTGNVLRVLVPSSGGAPVLELTLAAESDAVIDAYDVAGRAMGRLEASHRAAGVHRVGWTIRVPAGVYFCRARAGDWSAVERVVIR